MSERLTSADKLTADTEPTTQTGKRLLASDNRHTGPCPSTDDCWCGLSSAILAIEAEAAAMERERIIAAACRDDDCIEDHAYVGFHSNPFAEPTDDR